MGIAGILAYTFISKAIAAKRLNFFPGSIDGIDMQGLTPVLKLTLLAHNTSNQRMTINSLSADVTANNLYIGNASSFTQQTIEPNSQSPVQVNVRLGLFNIVNDLIRAVQYGNFSQDVRLTGNVNVDNLQVPIDMHFKAGT